MNRLPQNQRNTETGSVSRDMYDALASALKHSLESESRLRAALDRADVIAEAGEKYARIHCPNLEGDFSAIRNALAGASETGSVALPLGYDAADVAAIVRDLQAVEDGAEVPAWRDRDHRTQAGVLWRVIESLGRPVVPASVAPGEPIGTCDFCDRQFPASNLTLLERRLVCRECNPDVPSRLADQPSEGQQ